MTARAPSAAWSGWLVSGPSNGESLSLSGGFTYLKNTGFSGADGFSYRASNASGPGATTTVSIDVAGAGAPVAPSNFRVLGKSGNNVTFSWTTPTSGHDGSAATVGDAIARHAGKAEAARLRHERLSEAQRAALRAFLASL